jgi:transcriptional regulator with XRE-family HTH domain
MMEVGERLRKARRDRKVSLRALAEQAGTSASLLSQIETGKVNPSVMTLQNVATALGLPVRHFFPNDGGEGERMAEGRPDSEADALGRIGGIEEGLDRVRDADVALAERSDAPAGPVVRRGSRARIALEGGIEWDRLTPGQEEGAEFLEVRYPAGASSGPALARHSGREYVLVLEGELEIEVSFDRHVLAAGDAIAFDSTTPHRVTNTGEETARAVWMILDRR